MRKSLLLLLILLAGPYCASARGQDLEKKISLDLDKATLKQALDELSKKAAMVFIYSDIPELQQTLSIHVKDKPLKTVLTEMLARFSLTCRLIDDRLVISRAPPPASFLLKGRVTDTTGFPLQGATLRLKGSSLLRLTGAQGEFDFPNVNAGDVLQVSFIGYLSREVTVSGNGFLRISLQADNASLQEVTIVSTGYQELPKERATGSFTTVSKQVYEQQTGPDILSRLEAVTNGLSVFRNSSTRTAQMMVRGLSTISGPTSPLIVVDNFPYDGDMTNLNPNEVESVTVLKDAAAASIWGAKAGNGVIVITTKKGKYNQPLKITVNSSLTLGDKPDLGYLTPMTSADYIDFERYLYGKGYYASQIASTQYPLLSPVVQLLAKVAAGTMSQAAADQQINALRGLDVRNDYNQYVYRRAVNQQYHISLQGGNENTAYLFSTGYDQDISNLAADFSKLNIRSEATFRPVRRLQLTAGLLYTLNNNQTGRSGYGSVSPLPPYQLLAGAGGEALPVGQTYSQSFKDAAVATGHFLDWNDYPLTDYVHNYTATRRQDLLANFAAQYQLAGGLSVSILYQYEQQQTGGGTLYDDQSYFARNLVNVFTQVSGTTVKNYLPKGGIFDQQNSGLSSRDLRGQLGYDHSWGRHALSLLAGEELHTVTANASSARSYGYNPDLLTSAGVDYTTSYPNYVTKSNAFVPYANNFSQTLNRFVSFYANGAYTYGDTYTLSGSMRRDASNLFGAAINDKWTPLWSAGLGWIISREGFYHAGGVPFLKLRGSYGFSGNVDPSKSALTTIAYAATSPYTGSAYAAVSNFANPDLRWEKVKTINVGLDFKALQDRFSGSLEYYVKNATDLYATVPVDYTVGIGVATITKNVAEMNAHGIDLELNSVNIDRQVRWTSQLNLNYYRDKVTQYYLTSTNGSNYVSNSRSPVQGYPVWAVYSYRSAGLDAAGNPQGYLGGQLSENYTAITGSGTRVTDLVANGPRFPVFYGSMGHTVGYRGFSVTARLIYQFGSYFRRQSVNYSTLATTGEGNADYARRWQTPGDELRTSVPAVVYPLVSSRDNFYTGSSSLIEKGDCIRLQYVTLAYTLSRKQIRGLPFKVLQLYVNANNLGILWRANKFGIDPDYTYTNSVTPVPRNIAIGLRADL